MDYSQIYTLQLQQYETYYWYLSHSYGNNGFWDESWHPGHDGDSIVAAYFGWRGNSSCTFNIVEKKRYRIDYVFKGRSKRAKAAFLA